MVGPLPEYGLGAGGGDVLEVVLELEDDLGEGELALDGALFLQVAEVDQVAVASLLREHEEVPPAVGDLAMPENKKYIHDRNKKDDNERDTSHKTRWIRGFVLTFKVLH